MSMEISFLTALLGAILLGYLAQSTGICMVRGVAEWLKGAKTPSVSWCRLDRHPAMSALGRKQTLGLGLGNKPNLALSATPERGQVWGYPWSSGFGSDPGIKPEGALLKC